MATISEDQISEFKEGFSLFDRKGNGTIESDSLGDLLRALGQNPTQAQVRDLIAEADPSGTRVINFDTFLKVLMRPDGFKPAGTYHEFINGFKVFDKENDGCITVGELRSVLTNLGEKLSDAEVDELLKGVEVDKSGKVHYEDFVKMILSS
ncbi:hypothetical protein BGX23_005062 [Mortierella sp. AD031]|nr:hypothetical protein BGX23_005062 [Mortierella sp. AD031]KAG0219327.1 hypothetical protein BGX33_003602 [Mortierella sp. NVP41]